MTSYPTSADIYLEIDGKKMAVVQNYSVTTKKQSRTVEAFGEDEAVATIAGQPKYYINLSRLYITDAALADGISFYNLDNFSLVIVKPDRKIIFTGCSWSDITEQGELSQMVLEKISVIASKRIETAI